MTTSIQQLPEIVGLESRTGLVRIPPEIDVPMTPRVQRIVDTVPFRRLAGISQLGLVALVYPAAHHRRFEHSLGVFRLSLLFLRQLANDARFRNVVTPRGAERLMLAALLHDVGHWPFCHLIEDLKLAGLPRHEAVARRYLMDDELADAIRTDWSVAPDQVADLLEGRGDDDESRLLSSILSGPIDIDKMDYLMRDSLHAGVPYGRNFDQTRLIGSLCLNEAGDGLAISAKGRTAAEMMVFARYVMFSEVYWHHAVRSATAMFQRAIYRTYGQRRLPPIELAEHAFVEQLKRDSAADTSQDTHRLVDGLFGPRRVLFKRWIECDDFENPEIYRRIARKPYAWLSACSQRLAERLTAMIGMPIDADQVLIDSPPAKLEVQFNVDVLNPKSGRYQRFVELSPVVRTLAEKQFDDYVKRARVFVDPQLLPLLREIEDPELLLSETLVDADV